jgi:1-acyl-sn-glycerol-3-phosphate acyltransferase
MEHIRGTVRLLLFIGGSLVLYAFWWVSRFLIPNKQLWRQTMFDAWAGLFARIAGMRVEVIGRAPTPPFLLVCNHLSYVDVPVLRNVANGVFVAKKDVEDWFVAGRVIRDMGSIFIDRSNRRDIPRAGAKIIQRLSEGEGVIIFPEGTSTKGEDILPFNSSFLEFAARADIPVSYAALSYRTPEGGPTASERICWWNETSFLEHMWRMFMLKEFTAIVAFGEEPIKNPDRKQLAVQLRNEVRKNFIPVI